MKPYYERGGLTIFHGDNRFILPTIEAESISAVITDPPYGIGFMGKEWDTFAPARIADREAQKRRKGTEPTSARWPQKVGQMRQGGGVALRYDESQSGNAKFGAWCLEWSRECLRVLKPGGHILVSGGARTFHRVAVALEDAGFEIRDVLCWLYGSGFPKSHNLQGEHRGWGTALKPGWEPIIMARKPFRGTVAANVQLHGTGAINVDACRIGTEEAGWKGSAGGQGDVYAGRWGNGEPRPTAGRWPANVVLDEVAAELLDQQSGERKSGGRTVHDGEVEQSNWRRNEGRIDPKIKSAFHIDSSTGGASRFFYVAKASRAERNAGLNDLDAEPLNWSSGEQNPGSFQSDSTDRTSPNNHPTVKPLALMRWLITLVTPPGGIVLDPFGGSFTTLVAAAQLGFGAKGIDQEERYCAIGARRVDHALKQPRALTLEGIA